MNLGGRGNTGVHLWYWPEVNAWHGNRLKAKRR